MRSRTVLTWLTAVLIVFSLNACASIRYESTIKPSNDKALTMGDVRFSIINLEGNDDGLAARSREVYPDLFTDEWAGLPVVVKTDTSSDSSIDRSAFLTGFFGLGIIPFPGTEKTSYSVETSLIDSMGERIPAGKVDFEFKKVQWMTVLSPLGMMPVAGPSDIPRDYFNIFNITENASKAYNREITYKSSCHVEAIVKSLATADRKKLENDYQVRKRRLQEIMIEGRHCWSYLAPSISGGKSQADGFTVLIYGDYPKRGVQPMDAVIVARKDQTGAWHPVNGYLHFTDTLTAAGVLMDNGAPSRVVVRTVDEPPLEDFIETPDLKGADRARSLRWNNGVLLQAKNRSLLKILREKSKDELLALVTRIEMSILDLSEQSERAKDRAQTMVQKGEGDPAPERELSILCQQRIEVLKPILAALKQEAAGRRQ